LCYKLCMIRPRRGGRKEFLWPFIVMITGGLIVVLFIQLIVSFFGQREAEMRNKANFYTDYGRTEIMEWGSDEWVKAYNGGVVLDGDSIKTKAASRGVLVFYNGTQIRFDQNTEVSVSTLESNSDTDSVVLELEKGEIWVEQVISEKGVVDMVIKTGNLDIYSEGGLYDVLNRGEQAVMVMEGALNVDLMERTEGKDIVIDEVAVGVGQQIYMSETDSVDLVARENMNFLEALSGEWKEENFYIWNIGYELVLEDEVEENEEVKNENVEDGTGSVAEEVLPEYDDPVLTLIAPGINPYEFEGEQIYIVGTVSGYASKIVVTSYLKDGAAEPYKLSLFEAGGTDWSYNAARDYGNLLEGENEYLITAYDYDGIESDSMIVTINVISDWEELACEITVPTVTTIDGVAYDSAVIPEVTGDSVTIAGSVECAYGVVVNGYNLSLFQPGDIEWVYTAAVEYGNLVEGDNYYKVYSVDEEGNQSESFGFTVKYAASDSPIDE